MPIPLVLASASPARLSTLRAAGIEPRVIVSGVDEQGLLADLVRTAAKTGGGDPTPEEEALLLARAKAEDVCRSDAVDALVLGCDSVLEFDGQSLGKPRTPEIARDRWRAMRGRDGILHTGHWLIDARDGGVVDFPTVGATSSAVIHFARLRDAEIDAYVATGEPLQVAGGFTVDGLGGPFIESIEGDYHGVVGLSLPMFRGLLERIGVSIPELWA